MAKFNQEALDEIKKDPLLYASVAKEMGIDPGSLPMALKRNGNSLNQYNIVILVASHLGKDPGEVLEKDSEDKDKVSVNEQQR